MNVLSTINEEQAAHYLAERHFEIGSEINRLSLNNNFAGIIQVLVNQTRSLLEKGEFKIVSQHLKYLDWIYQRGNNYIQEIVENLFVRFNVFNDGVQRCNGKNNLDHFLSHFNPSI